MTRRSALLPPTGGTTREMADSIRLLAHGRLQTVVEMDLTTGATTTVQHPLLIAESAVQVSPVAASAAGLVWWISGQTNGACTINHPTGASGRRVRISWIG